MPAPGKPITIGVISDTHGLLRTEAVEAMRGVAAIIHAGDIGHAEILHELAKIAPVTAVRGNIDSEPWACQLPQSEIVEAGGRFLYVLHDLAQLDLNPEAAGFAAVISGHSHRAQQETKRGVLYFNPGSAGPRRFHLPVSVGRLFLAAGRVRGKIINIG